MAWLGLAAAAGLWVAAIHVETPRLEETLSADADKILRENLGLAGKVLASGRDLRVEGLAFDESARAETIAAIRALPGVKNVADALAPPPARSPYEWRAAWDGAALKLSGAAPSPAARAALNAAARKAAPGARIVDDMSYASGAPPGFVDQAAGLLAALSRSRGGEARLRDKIASLDAKTAGKAEQPAAQSSDKPNLSATGSPKAATGGPGPARAQKAASDPARKPAPAEDCRTALARTAGAAAIGFEGAVRLTAASEAPLKALAAAAKACPGAVVRIAGSGGEPELSWRRAEAVAAFLLAQGLAPRDLDIAGQGEAPPTGVVVLRVK
jgi:OOP family OmpA-OmpF porin